MSGLQADVDLVPVINGEFTIDKPTNEIAKACGKALSEGRDVRVVKLNGGSITCLGVSYIAKALKGNTTLRHLGLGGNNVGDMGCKSLGKLFGGHLTSLDLSNAQVGLTGLSTLVQGITKVPSLQVLDISDNKLPTEAGHQIQILLKNSSSIRKLYMAGNCLQDRGMMALAAALSCMKPPRVVCLDVGRNNIGDKGVNWLARGISALCRSECVSATGKTQAGGCAELLLRDNSITHEGARELAGLLSEERCQRHLRDLDISCNVITVQGFVPLVEALQGCRSLTRLDASGCMLGPDALTHTAMLLRVPGNRLRTIELSPTPGFADQILSDNGDKGLYHALHDGLSELAKALLMADGVTELGLGAFLFPRENDAASVSIQESLQRNAKKAEVVTAAMESVDVSIPTSVSGPASVGSASPMRVAGRTRARAGACASPNSGRGMERKGSGVEVSKTAKRPGSLEKSRNTGATERNRGVTTPVRNRAGAATTGSSDKQRSSSGTERTRLGASDRLKKSSGVAPKATPPRLRTHTSSPTVQSPFASRVGVNARRALTPPPVGKLSSSPSRCAKQQQQHQRLHHSSSRKETSVSESAPDELDTMEDVDPPMRMARPQNSGSVVGAGSMTERVTPRGQRDHGVSSVRKPPQKSGSGDGNLRGTTVCGNFAVGENEHGRGRCGFSGKGTREVFTTSGGPCEHKSKATFGSLTPQSAPSSPLPPPSPSASCSRSPRPGHRSGESSLEDIVAQCAAEIMVEDIDLKEYDKDNKRQSSPPPVAPAELYSFRWGEGGSLAASGEGASGMMQGQVGVSAARTHQSAEMMGYVGGSNAEDSKSGVMVRAGVLGSSTSTAVVAQGGRYQGTELDVSEASQNQQLVRVTDLGVVIGPMVAREVAKELGVMEVKMKGDLDAAMLTMKQEIHMIDQQGSKARTKMEKRISRGLKGLLNRIQMLERRYAAIEMDNPVEDGGHRRISGDSLESIEEERSRKQPPWPMQIGKYGHGAVSSLPAEEGESVAGAEGMKSIAGVGISDPVTGSVGEGEEEEEEEAAAEADMIRRLEEKMSALELKLRGHEERQINDRGRAKVRSNGYQGAAGRGVGNDSISGDTSPEAR
ncbi:unnamed protein product [Choristocarpus tenellus]